MQIVLKDITLSDLRSFRDQLIAQTDAAVLNHGRYVAEKGKAAYEVDEVVIPSVSLFLGTDIMSVKEISLKEK